MKAIYKFQCEIGTDEVSMPKGAEILTVQMQMGTPCMWALIDSDEPLYEPRHFRWVGTGHAIDFDTGKHVGTIQVDHGSLIFHLFEVEKGKR